MRLSGKFPICTLGVVCLISTLGCDAPIERFESNAIYAKRWEISESIDLSQPVADSHALLKELFGTPDRPKWPEFLVQDGDSLVSLERLQRAAGAFSSDEEGVHVGLYREHCVVCHGINGNGRGPSAGLLYPYPRDFRLGQVKFKSTPIGDKPTRDDLRQILQRGVAGTSMPSFQLLEDEDREALVDYLIYLAIRGEAERKMLRFSATELDLEGGERLYDPSRSDSAPEEFADNLEMVEEWILDIQSEWQEADDEVLEIVQPPAGFPLLGSQADPQAIEQSVANGAKLFQSTTAGCSFCHGAEAMGDGQVNNYDDWTRDWTVLAGIDPKDRVQLQPMLDLGALKPRNILPRNLTLGVFHGGSSPQELYTRIVNGIEGTNMPAAPIKPDNPMGLSNEEVWDLVNYLRSFLPEDQLVLPESEIADGTASSDEVAQR